MSQKKFDETFNICQKIKYTQIIKSLFNQMEPSPKITKAEIEQCYKNILQGRVYPPESKQEDKWAVTYRFIDLQPYCPDCKKWRNDTSYDYCSECGFDFYSHVFENQRKLAPIRRGRCSSCWFSGSLNSNFLCEMCFYKFRNDKQKAQLIQQKRLKIQREVEESPQNAEIKRLKQLKGQQFLNFMMMRGMFDNVSPEQRASVKFNSYGPAQEKRLNELYQEVKLLYQEKHKQEGITY